MNQYIHKLLARLHAQDTFDSIRPKIKYTHLFDDPFESNVFDPPSYPEQQYKKYWPASCLQLKPIVPRSIEVDLLSKQKAKQMVSIKPSGKKVQTKKETAIAIERNDIVVKLESRRIECNIQQQKIAKLLPHVNKAESKNIKSNESIIVNRYITNVVRQLNSIFIDKTISGQVEFQIDHLEKISHLKSYPRLIHETNSGVNVVYKSNVRRYLGASKDKLELHIGSLNVNVETDSRNTNTIAVSSRNKASTRRVSYRKSSTKRPNSFGIKQM